jgi:hypothetical protein
MKQKLLFAGMAAIALTSCSNDEAVEINNGHAIGFRTAMATRATETTTANLEGFFVTAFYESTEPYFSDLEFKKGTGDLFESDTKYFYPGDARPLTFYAYAPSKTALGGTMTITKDSQKLEGFAPNTDISKQVDFIAGAAKGDAANDGADGAFLEFSHCLSQIEVKAKSGNTSYDFEVKGVRIGCVGSKGDFTFPAFSAEDPDAVDPVAGTWTLTEGEKASYDKTLDEAVKLTADAVSLMAGDNAMLIPQQLTAWDTEEQENTSKGAYIAVLVKITTKSGAQVYPFASDPTDANAGYAWAAIPVSTLWEAGKKYVYTLNFTTGAGYVDPTEDHMPGVPVLVGEIKFNVTVEGWTEEAAGNDIEMPNDPGTDYNPDGNDTEDPFLD